MAAMNQGANDGNGHIVGVIHEMFVVDGSDWLTGSSKVFTEGKHELLVASGNDLQERKRLLVEGADALVVLPGGPGTWDEVCCMHPSFSKHKTPVTTRLYVANSAPIFIAIFILFYSCGKWHVPGI